MPESIYLKEKAQKHEMEAIEAEKERIRLKIKEDRKATRDRIKKRDKW
jgi:hypothetical protein